MQRACDTATVCKSIFLFGITDAPDYISDAVFIVHLCGGSDLAHNMNRTGFGDDLAGAAAHGVLFQKSIQNTVGDLITSLIGYCPALTDPGLCGHQ